MQSAGFGDTVPGLGEREPEPALGLLLSKRYRLVQKLGEGGMGQVFLAQDEVLESEVALKFIQPALLTHEGAARRFKREVAALQRLSHPGIVRVFDLQEDPDKGWLYYSMEHLTGLTLRAVLAHHPDGLPPELLRRAFREVCEAVSYAHASELLHRDLKPENVIDTPGGCKVIDFGLVRFGQGSRLTLPGAALGSAVYVAPEQLRGAEVDARADVYALGALLYELSCGHPPQGRFRPLRDRKPELPQGLDAIIDASMQERPDDRPASVRAILEAYLDAWTTGPAPGPPLEASTPAPTLDAPAPPAEPPPALNEPLGVEPQAAPAANAPDEEPPPAASPLKSEAPAEAPQPAPTESRAGPSEASGDRPLWLVTVGALALLAIAASLFGASQQPLISSPTPGATLSSRTFTVTGRATPGATVTGGGGSALCDDSGAFELRYRASEDGPHELDLEQRAGGRASPLPKHRVTIDDAPPEIALDRELPALTRDSTIELEGAVSDAVSAVTLTADGRDVALVGGRFRLTWALAEGPNSLRLEARDAAGHLATRELSVVSDSTAPSVSELSPAEGAWLRSRFVTVKGLVLGASALTVEGAEVPLRGEAPDLAVGGHTAPLKGRTFELELELEEGDHSINLELTDASGNTTTLTRRVRIDATPPELELATPVLAGVTFLGPAARLKGQVKDAHLQALTLDGEPAPLADGRFDIDASAHLNTATQLVATDAAGNTTTLELTPLAEVTILELDAPDGWLRSRELILRGRTNLPGALVSIADSSASARATLDGRFALPLTLPEGETRLVLTVSANGEGASERALNVRVDASPPVFLSPAAGPVTRDSDGRVEIRVSEEHLASLTSSQGTLSLTEAGRWSLKLPAAEGVEEVRLTARDEAGNEATLTLSLASPEAASSPQATPAVLLSRAAWQAASTDELKEAAAWVLERLNGQIEFANIRRYDCGGATHTILTFRHLRADMELNLIPGDEVRLGSDDGESNEAPAHRLSLPPMLVGVSEVTQAQWDRIGGEDERNFRGGARPIEGVSWDEVQAWIRTLDAGLRLPTEAEWEYACRAGTPSPWCFGDDEGEVVRYGWIEANAKEETHDVKGRKPNAFGLYDMHGNVWEWCESVYTSSYGPDAERSPDRRVTRGGSWRQGASAARSARRFGDSRSERFNNVGFRLVMPLDARPAAPTEPREPGAASIPEVLRDWRRFGDAEPEAYKAALKWVVERLGADFKGVEVKRYRCGGQGYVIATFEHIKTGLRLNLIPGGSYEMGSPKDEEGRYSDEGPAHRVTIPPLLVGVTEVTQAQWDKLGGADDRERAGEALPIVGVTWEAARDWLERAGDGLRLPSEAEWEFACRATTTTPWSFGEDAAELAEYAWFESNSEARTHEVGAKQPNAFGLYDMHGNVWEWCQDSWSDDYSSAPSDHRPRSPDGRAERIQRGGACTESASALRSAIRHKAAQDARFRNLGFRVVRALD